MSRFGKISWIISWTVEPGRVQFKGSQRVRQVWRQLAHMDVNMSIISDSVSLQIKETYTSPAPRFIDIYLLEMDSLGKQCYGSLNCQQRKQGRERGVERGKKKRNYPLNQVHCPHFTSILAMSLKNPLVSTDPAYQLDSTSIFVIMGCIQFWVFWV